MFNQKEISQAPLISIIMPTYNQERFIEKAIESVVAQTYKNWELVIINNFSTDQTKSVVESYNNPKIKLIDFANLGVIAASRNLGIKRASGELIAFLDSDDYWAPEKLRLCLEKLQTGYDLVCHGEYFFRDGSEELEPTTYGPQNRCDFNGLVTHGNCLSTSAIVLKKGLLDVVGLFDEEKKLITAEDFDLWIRIAQNGAKIGIIDEMLGYYRLHPTSASASNVRNAQATLAVLEKAAKIMSMNIFGRIMAFILRIRIKVFIYRFGARET